MKWFALLSAMGAFSASALAQNSIATATAPDAPRHSQNVKDVHDHLLAILKEALKDLDAKTRDKVIQKVLAALKKSDALGVRDSILIAPSHSNGAPLLTRVKGEPIILNGDGTALFPKRADGAAALTPQSKASSLEGFKIIAPDNAQDTIVIRKGDGQTIAVAPKAKKTDGVSQTKPSKNTTFSKTVDVQGGQANVVLDGVNAADVIVIVNGKKYRLVPADGSAPRAAKGETFAFPTEGLKIEDLESFKELKGLDGMKLEGLESFKELRGLDGMKLEGLEGLKELEGMEELKDILPQIHEMLKNLHLEGMGAGPKGVPMDVPPIPEEVIRELKLAQEAKGGKVVWYEPNAKNPMSQTSMQKYEQLAKEMEAKARAMEKSGVLQKRFAGAKDLEMSPSELAKMVEQLKRNSDKQKLDMAKMTQLELAAQNMKRNASNSKASDLVEMAKKLEKLAKELLEEARRAGAK